MEEEQAVKKPAQYQSPMQGLMQPQQGMQQNNMGGLMGNVGNMNAQTQGMMGQFMGMDTSQFNPFGGLGTPNQGAGGGMGNMQRVTPSWMQPPSEQEAQQIAAQQEAKRLADELALAEAQNPRRTGIEYLDTNF